MHGLGTGGASATGAGVEGRDGSGVGLAAGTIDGMESDGSASPGTAGDDANEVAMGRGGKRLLGYNCPNPSDCVRRNGRCPSERKLSCLMGAG